MSADTSKDMTVTSTVGETDLRDLAVKRLRKKRDLRAHALAFVMVNSLLIAVWVVTGAGFFWPVFPIFGWGIGLAFNIWDVYSPDVPTEDAIRAEMDRLARR